jgi:hypothetical protein
MYESGFTMLVHAIVIGAFLYVVMKYGMHTSDPVSQDRSVFYGCIALLYMVMFGHGAPTRINPNLLF